MRIDEELAEVARCGGFFAIRIGEPNEGWRPIADCYADGFSNLIAVTAQENGTTDLRVAASLVQFAIASRLWSPAIACALIHGIVPDFAELHCADDSLELLAARPEGLRVDSEAQIAPALYEAVVERNLEPLAAGLRVKMAPGLLYGNAASAMVGATRALYALRPELRDRATELARVLLDHKRLAGTGTVKYNLAFRRHSCCLYYRIADGAKCGDCGLLRK
jgi:hypothetical protein